jgi:hypothetical protein
MNSTPLDRNLPDIYGRSRGVAGGMLRKEGRPLDSAIAILGLVTHLMTDIERTTRRFHLSIPVPQCLYRHSRQNTAT